MKPRSLLLTLAATLTLGAASAVPVKLGNVPVTVEPNAKLLTLSAAGIRTAFPSAAGRPDAVFMTEDRKVSVAFEWRASKLNKTEVGTLVEQFPSVIRAQVPNVKTLKANLLQVSGTPWAPRGPTLSSGRASSRKKTTRGLLHSISLTRRGLRRAQSRMAGQEAVSGVSSPCSISQRPTDL